LIVDVLVDLDVNGDGEVDAEDRELRTRPRSEMTTKGADIPPILRALVPPCDASPAESLDLGAAAPN
jgi:hypothetical protein